MTTTSSKPVAHLAPHPAENDKQPSPLLLGVVLTIVGAIGFSPWIIVKMGRETPPAVATAADMSSPQNWGQVNAHWHHSHLMQDHVNYMTQASYAARMQRERKFENAVVAYTRLIEETSTHRSGNYVARGNAYLALSRYDLAVSDFSNAIGLDPVDADAYRGRSEAYRQLGQTALSQSDMNKSMQLNR